jgi:hypothetical protein
LSWYIWATCFRWSCIYVNKTFCFQFHIQAEHNCQKQCLWESQTIYSWKINHIREKLWTICRADRYLLLSLTSAVGRTQKTVNRGDLLLGSKVVLNKLERVLWQFLQKMRPSDSFVTSWLLYNWYHNRKPCLRLSTEVHRRTQREWGIFEYQYDLNWEVIFIQWKKKCVTISTNFDSSSLYTAYIKSFITNF